MDVEKYLLPDKLDEPYRFIIFTQQEIGIVFGPLLIGFSISMLEWGVAISASLYFLMRKLQKGDADFLVNCKYWIFPSFVSGFKATPPSSVRVYYS